MNECDCGEPKNPDHEACARCLFLDGDAPGVGTVIAALRRSAAPMTVYELADESHMARRYVLLKLRDLEASGRVKRTMIDGDQPDEEKSATGRFGDGRRFASARAQYQLVG